MAQQPNPGNTLALEVADGLWLVALASRRRRHLIRGNVGVVDAAFVDDERFVFAHPDALNLCTVTRHGFAVLRRRRADGRPLADAAAALAEAFDTDKTSWPGDYAARRRDGLKAAKAGEALFVAEKPGGVPESMLPVDEAVALGLDPSDAVWRGRSGRVYAMALGKRHYALEHITDGGERRPFDLMGGKTDVFGDAMAFTSIDDEPGGESSLVLHRDNLYRWFAADGRLEPLPRFDYGQFDQPPWNVCCLADGRYAMQSMFTLCIRDADHKEIYRETGEPKGGFATAHNTGSAQISMTAAADGHLLVYNRAPLKTIYDGCQVRILHVTPTKTTPVHESQLPLFAPSLETIATETYAVTPNRDGFRLRNPKNLT